MRAMCKLGQIHMEIWRLCRRTHTHTHREQRKKDEQQQQQQQQQRSFAVGDHHPTSSALESKLLFCKKDSPFTLSEPPSAEKPAMFPVPKSQVLGKLKDFLSVMSESNKKLMEDAKNNPDNYDIEVLSGKESELIEMDLMLGVADLHTPEAVAAAESAMAGKAPVISLAESSSESESDDDDNDKDSSLPVKSESKDTARDSSSTKSRNQNPKSDRKLLSSLRTQMH